MGYTKQDFTNDEYLCAEQLSKIEDAIIDLEDRMEDDEDDEKIEERLSNLEAAVKELQYVEIKINSVGIKNNITNGGVAEIGSVVSNVTVNWNLNKVPNSITLSDPNKTVECSAVQKGEASISGEYSENTTFTLIVTDEKKSASANTKLNFYDGIYYGTVAKPDEVDSEFILSLTKILASGKNRTVNVSGGEGLYFFYAYPASLGDSIFNIRKGGLIYAAQNTG